MVEFALVLPLLLTLVLGLVDFGKALNYWIDQTHLANEAARWAAVDRNPGSTGSATLQQYIKDHADSAELRDAGNGAKVCVDFPLGTSQVGDPVEVKIQYVYNWLPFFQNRLGWTATTISGTATMRLEALPTNYSSADNIGTCE
jgi:Flp pilus assembly protein TadG